MEGEVASRERLIADLKTVFNDADELLKAIASQASDKIAVARQRIEQSLIEGRKSLGDAEKALIQRSKEAADVADDYVRENPWSAVGIAAGIGIVIGLLMRRS
jgi:ElaB/YqjD/DUF883 family membrane-anchored ribosome-binding protein